MSLNVPMRLFFHVLIILVLGVSIARAEVVDRQVRMNCQATPQLGTTNYPGFRNVLTNNKIAVPPGKSVIQTAQVVYFYGRVFDQGCVPVDDAKIELWQADPQGRYRFATDAALTTPDPTFAGSGRTYTNNLGEFMFVTLYPGPYQYTTTVNGRKVTLKRAPHFNIRITHEDYKTFDGNVFFRGDTRNAEDHKLSKLSHPSQAMLMMDVMPRYGDWNYGVQSNIDLFLPGNSPWNRF